MEKPLFIINCKNYSQASGEAVARFIEYAEAASQNFGVEVLVAPPVVDTFYYALKTPERIISQSVDVVDYGSSTGHIPLYRLMDMGIMYSLINHSENRVEHMLIKDISLAANDAGFKLVVCVQSIDELSELIDLDVKPYAYAFEPPDLIGTGRSVSKYASKELIKAVEICNENNIPCLCGAGISTAEDVELAMEYGVSGILVASGIVKDKNPLEKIMKFSHILSQHQG